MANESQSLADGEAAAAILAGGIGSLALGLFVTLAEASAGFKEFATWSTGIGPLSGKVGLALIAWFGSWIVLHFMWKDKDVDLQRISTIAFVLVALGFLGTFPTFFQMFAAE